MDSKSFRRNIGMVVFCIFLNTLGKLIAAGLKLPIWLDVVGTCVAAYFTGPLGAVISGAAGNLLFSMLTGGKW